MCIFGAPKARSAAPIIPSDSNAEARRQEDLEARLRRQRSGAAANILTSPGGIPARGVAKTLGGV